MKPQWESQIAQFESAMTAWRGLVQNLPPAFATAQGSSMATTDLGSSLESALAFLRMAGSSTTLDPIAVAVYQPTIESATSVIASSIATLVNQPGAINYLDQIAQHLWSLKTTMPWLTPIETASSFQATLPNIALATQAQALKSLTNEYSEAVARVSQILKDVEAKQRQAEDLTEKILGQTRTVDTAKTNAESSAAQATANKDAISMQLGQLSAGLAKFEGQRQAIDSLMDRATKTLEAASKVGMADSFSTRHSILEGRSKSWEWSYRVGIFLLIIGAGFVLTGYTWVPPIVSNGNIDLGALATRSVILGPVIWFTWFAARQYGTTVRLMEDYAFKAASALAYVGYRREMAEDAEMLRLLRESAITSFGSSPTRVFRKNDPASPLHDLIEKAIEKAPTEKIFETIRALFPGKS